MGKLRAAIVTDIHFGIDDRGKLGTKAPRLMTKFLKAVDKTGPDVVIDIGDRVTARERSQDKHHLKSLSRYFNQIAAPVYNVTGNHDIRYLTANDNETITKNPTRSYSRDEGGYHLVFFNPVHKHEDRGVLQICDDDLEWLKHDLDKTDKPTIVFSHVPLDNVSEDRLASKNWKFAGRFGYPEKAEILREIMEDSQKVVLCMSGHIHRNRYRKINGIHYICQQSLTHKWRDHYRIPSGTWSLLEASDDKITISLKGKVKKTYELTPRPLQP